MQLKMFLLFEHGFRHGFRSQQLHTKETTETTNQTTNFNLSYFHTYKEKKEINLVQFAGTESLCLIIFCNKAVICKTSQLAEALHQFPALS